MPRIPDAFLDVVVYIYDSQESAENASPVPESGGTGFMVGVLFPSIGIPGEGQLYIVTNAHVVEKSASVFVRVNSLDGGADIVKLDRASWHCHPQGDDVCVAPIDLDDKKSKVVALETRQFVTKEFVDRYAVGPGDETFTVGRFINHEGKERNTPTVRAGNIAMMPHEPIPNPKTGGSRFSYLVETRSQSGYSGSPVFLYLSPWYLREPGESLTNGVGPYLLGIMWGYAQTQEVGPLGVSAKNTGMIAVVPVEKLAELLDIEPLVTQRREAELIRAEQLRNAPVKEA